MKLGKSIKIVVNGYPLAGKDTFVDICAEILAERGYRVKKISSVDIVKDAAVLLGWDKQKDEKGRQFLSDLKDMSTANYDGPMRYMKGCMERSNPHHDHVFFFHIREPEEIAKFVAEFPDTVTILMQRDSSEKHHTNTSDSKVLHYPYTYIVINNGTLAELEEKAETAMERITNES